MGAYSKSVHGSHDCTSWMLTNTSHFSPRHILVEREVIFHLQDERETRLFVQADDTGHMWIGTGPKPSSSPYSKHFGTLSPNSQREIVPSSQREFPCPSADPQVTKEERRRKKDSLLKNGAKILLLCFGQLHPFGIIWLDVTAERCGFLTKQS